MFPTKLKGKKKKKNLQQGSMQKVYLTYGCLLKAKCMNGPE